MANGQVSSQLLFLKWVQVTYEVKNMTQDRTLANQMKENIVAERKWSEHEQRQKTPGSFIEKFLRATEFIICCYFKYSNCEYLIAL